MSDVVERGMLMKRMDQGYQKIRSNIQKDSDLKAQSEEVIHEASLLVAWMKLTSEKEYVFADEPNYQKFSNEMISASLKAIDAAKKGKFAEYKSAMSTIKQRCDACHSEYR